jgi:hypothetical protein
LEIIGTGLAPLYYRIGASFIYAGIICAGIIVIAI